MGGYCVDTIRDEKVKYRCMVGRYLKYTVQSNTVNKKATKVSMQCYNLYNLVNKIDNTIKVLNGVYLYSLKDKLN